MRISWRWPCLSTSRPKKLAGYAHQSSTLMASLNLMTFQHTLHTLVDDLYHGTSEAICASSVPQSVLRSGTSTKPSSLQDRHCPTLDTIPIVADLLASSSLTCSRLEAIVRCSFLQPNQGGNPCCQVSASSRMDFCSESILTSRAIQWQITQQGKSSEGLAPFHRATYLQIHVF